MHFHAKGGEVLVLAGDFMVGRQVYGEGDRNLEFQLYRVISSDYISSNLGDPLHLAK
ncbi:MAG: hypothetical protein F6K19_25120 [Cyanothece sp. SIO1E1]|nr:hypothetical protein [Cyanothece sp. SIO1E1]